MSPTPPPAEPTAYHRILYGVALAMVAVNARPALSSLGPVLPEALAATGLSRTAASLITTLPVLLLGGFGLAGPWVSRRFGVERTVLWLTLLLVLAILVRVFGTAPALIVGCAVGAAAIGTVNVILPAIIKRDFSDRMPLMMGVYTMALTGGAAIGAGATAPLAASLGGWARGLAVWALPAFAAAAAWAGQSRGPAARAGSAAAAEEVAAPPVSLWRSPLAWQVTLFTGLQSSLAYALFAWAPTMLRDRGFDPIEAGLAFSLSIVLQIPAALVAPALAARGRDQRLAVAVGVGLSLAGVGGFLFAPLSQIWFWAVIMGVGQGAVFALALTVVVLRSRDGRMAAGMSAMAQGVGYTLAAAAPLLAGLLRDLTGNWTASAATVLAIGAASGLFGLGAGRNLRIGE